MTIAAIVFALAAVLVALFQLALAAGAPWGVAAMGGKFPGKFSPGLRVLAIVQGAVVIMMALVILTKAGLLFSQWQTPANIGAWVVVGFTALTLLGNVATQSKIERALWAPVAAVMLLCSIIVAL